LDYLGEINSKKAVPEINNLVNDQQGDFVNEKVAEVLQKIDGISPEIFTKSFAEGDEIIILCLK